MARKKWRLNRNYAHAHFRILSGKRTGHYSEAENFRIQSDTCGWLKTIRIRCVWTRTFSHPQKNICEKKTFRIRVDMAFETAPTLLYAQPQPLICEAILVFLIA